MNPDTMLFKNNKDQVKDLFSLRIYSLQIDTSIEELISACYNANADVQDMLSAMKNEFI